MELRFTVLFAAIWLALVTTPPSAHHSFAAEYDSNKPVMLNGALAKMEWQNPHARIYGDVKDETGKGVHWELPLGSPNRLMGRGWTRNYLKPGDSVIVEGYLATDRSRLANARNVTLANGPTFSPVPRTMVREPNNVLPKESFA